MPKGCLTPISWETRNLGRQSFAIADEFLAEPDQCLLNDSLQDARKQWGSIFIQARVGKSELAAVPVLQRAGFLFAETALVPFTAFRKNEVFTKFLSDKSSFLPARYPVDQIGLSILDRDDATAVATVKTIAAESFSDDRFHLDAACPKEIADQRFSYWVEDLIADEGVVFYLLHHLDSCTGFMARKGENLILAGFAQRYLKSGLGDFLWLSVIEDMQRCGLERTNTVISANNVAVLNLYVRLGFKFKDPSVTLHYWSDNPLGTNEQNEVSQS